MIPRTLVPRELSPAIAEVAAERPRRLSTLLDSRTVVPRDLPLVPLDAKTSIPAHVPLEALTSRTLVPRDMATTPLEIEGTAPRRVPLTALDSRIVVPHGAQPALLLARGLVGAAELPDVLEPDVVTTGEANLLTKRFEEQVSRWSWQAKA